MQNSIFKGMTTWVRRIWRGGCEHGNGAGTLSEKYAGQGQNRAQPRIGKIGAQGPKKKFPPGAPQGPKIGQKYAKNCPQGPPGPRGTILDHFGDQKKIQKKMKIPGRPARPPRPPQGPPGQPWGCGCGCVLNFAFSVPFYFAIANQRTLMSRCHFMIFCLFSYGRALYICVRDAHRLAGRQRAPGGWQAGGRANSTPTGVHPHPRPTPHTPHPTHPRKIAIPRCGGQLHMCKLHRSPAQRQGPGVHSLQSGPKANYASPPQRGIAILGGWGVDTSGGGVGTTTRPPPARPPAARRPPAGLCVSVTQIYRAATQPVCLSHKRPESSINSPQMALNEKHGFSQNPKS